MYLLYTKSMIKEFKHGFILKYCLFGSVKLTKNADSDK